MNQEATFLVQGEDPPVTNYQCSECNAEDSDRGHNPPAPQLLNCWNCGAGLSMAPQEMYARHKGMFPKAPPEEIPN